MLTAVVGWAQLVLWCHVAWTGPQPPGAFLCLAVGAVSPGRSAGAVVKHVGSFHVVFSYGLGFSQHGSWVSDDWK